MSDVIGNEPRPRPATPRLRAAGGTTIGALAVVIALVLTSGIVAATRLGGGGPQPEDVLPGSAIAFAKLDLDPPAGQKMAIRTLAGKFPKAPAKEVSGLRDALVQGILDDADVGLDYEADVKPWLGDRVGFAVLPAPGEPIAAVAIQVEDRRHAERAVRKGAPDGGLAFRQGYALLTESGAQMTTVLAELEKGALADNERFADDVDRLAGEQVALGWTDNAAIGKVFLDASGGDDSGQLAKSFTGRSVFGLHAADDYVELETATFDGTAGPAGGRTDTLTRLPEDTVGAALVHDLHGSANQAFANLGPLGMAGGGLMPYFLMGAAGEMETIEEECEVVTPTAPGMPPTACPDREDEPEEGGWEAAMAVFGDLREDVLPMLREQTTIALGPLPREGALPSVGLVARAQGPGNVASALDRLLRKYLGDKFKVAVDGDLVYAGIDPAYVDRLRRGGRLGEDEGFRLAMGPLTDDTVAALYVNLERVAERVGSDYPEEVRPIDAVGLVATRAGSESRLRLRAVVR